MADLFYSPVHHGTQEVTIPDGGGSFEVPSGGSGFAARIYYPATETGIHNVPVRPGKYPLIAFAHGDRSGSQNAHLCPKDVSMDYKRWIEWHRPLARVGFVVVSPAMHDVLNSSEAAGDRLESAIRWMYNHWPNREVVTFPQQSFVEVAGANRRSFERSSYRLFSDPLTFGPINVPEFDEAIPVGRPAPLGLMAHSWGVKACGLVAARGNFPAAAYAAVAGTFDTSEAINDFLRADLPSFLACGTNDSMTYSYLNGLWSNTPYPKHQAAIQDLDHWDWFGGAGILPCESDQPQPDCFSGQAIGSIMMISFMKKYLGGMWELAAHLMAQWGPFQPYDWDNSDCAMQVRWEAPTAANPGGASGKRVFGDWDGTPP